MNLRTLAPVFGLLISPLVWAQSTPATRMSGKVAQNLSARAAATDLVKSGNSVRALTEIRAGAKRGVAAMMEDTQLVGELCVIAASLGAVQHGTARDAAQLAVNEGAKAKGKVPRREAAYIDAKLGELMEVTNGDVARAQEFYASALALDASRRDADAGLKRLARLEALLRAKETENAILRSGGK